MDRISELRQSTGAAICMDCGKCTATCPLAAFGRFPARTIAAQEVDDHLLSRETGVGRCLTCAACDIRCPQGVRFIDYVRGLREFIPPQDREPCPHSELIESAARLASGERAPVRDTRWLGADLEVAETGEIALFVGCLPLFDLLFKNQLHIEMMDIARAAVRLLNELGIKPVIASDERCCGHDLLWRGDSETFADLARANADAFARRGVKHIVTTCAECCRTWQLDVPEVVDDYRPRVEHLAEFLAPRIESGSLSFSPDGAQTVTYQDPCRLGRHLGVYDGPRTVVQSIPGTRLEEMSQAGRAAQCCGTSGFIYCDSVSRQLQVKRLHSAAATGAQKLLTACPKCLIHFACAQSEDRRRDDALSAVEVQDLAVFAASRLQAADGGAADAALSLGESKGGNAR